MPFKRIACLTEMKHSGVATVARHFSSTVEVIGRNGRPPGNSKGRSRVDYHWDKPPLAVALMSGKYVHYDRVESIKGGLTRTSETMYTTTCIMDGCLLAGLVRLRGSLNGRHRCSCINTYLPAVMHT